MTLVSRSPPRAGRAPKPVQRRRPVGSVDRQGSPRAERRATTMSPLRDGEAGKVSERRAVPPMSPRRNAAALSSNSGRALSHVALGHGQVTEVARASPVPRESPIRRRMTRHSSSAFARLAEFARWPPRGYRAVRAHGRWHAHRRRPGTASGARSCRRELPRARPTTRQSCRDWPARSRRPPRR